MRYIIAPTADYLSHGGMHKYIDRVKTASGKWRYIYSRAAEKTKKKIKDVSGVTAKENLSKAVNKYNKTYDTTEKANIDEKTKRSARLKRLDAVHKAESKYKNTALGKMEEYKKQGTQFANDVLSPYLNDAKKKVITKTGELSYKGKEQAAKVSRKLKRAKKRLGIN